MVVYIEWMSAECLPGRCRHSWSGTIPRICHTRSCCSHPWSCTNSRDAPVRPWLRGLLPLGAASLGLMRLSKIHLPEGVSATGPHFQLLDHRLRHTMLSNQMKLEDLRLNEKEFRALLWLPSKYSLMFNQQQPHWQYLESFWLSKHRPNQRCWQSFLWGLDSSEWCGPSSLSHRRCNHRATCWLKRCEWERALLTSFGSRSLRHNSDSIYILKIIIISVISKLRVSKDDLAELTCDGDASRWETRLGTCGLTPDCHPQVTLPWRCQLHRCQRAATSPL